MHMRSSAKWYFSSAFSPRSPLSTALMMDSRTSGNMWRKMVDRSIPPPAQSTPPGHEKISLKTHTPKHISFNSSPISFFIHHPPPFGPLSFLLNARGAIPHANLILQRRHVTMILVTVTSSIVLCFNSQLESIQLILYAFLSFSETKQKGNDALQLDLVTPQIFVPTWR